MLSTKKELPGAKYNVLNDYRSYTYVYTLACLGRDSLSNPSSFRKSSLDYVILKSGGKDKGFNASAAKGAVSTSSKSKEQLDAKELVEGFNKESPGRFDMYIDNVEFDCVIAPGEKNGSSVATNIRFEVYEPLSLNGFIEALHVSAVSAGFESYTQAAYLLKLEFWGYNDDDEFGKPEAIPSSSRYFVFNFTGVDITVTEQGTRYTCQGVPSGDLALAETDKIQTDVKMSGKTVEDVLKNFFNQYNQTLDDRAKKEKGDDKIKNHHTYRVVFPEAPGPKEKLDTTKKETNKIGKAEMASFLTNNAVIKMQPIEKKADKKEDTKSDPNAKSDNAAAPTPQQDGKIKYDPTGSVIQFSQGSKISDIITAVIRDSTYLENILKDVKGAQDEYGNIDYFLIQVNVIPKNENDSISEAPLYIYEYIVIPHRVHFTKLPLQKNVQHDPEKLMPLVKRVYNYIYTGKNIDVLNFKITFNNLFFQAIPPKAGNEQNVEQASSAGMNNTSQTSVGDASSAKPKQSVIGGTNVVATNGNDGDRGNRAGAPRTDPYFKFAEYAHNAILESVDQCTAEIEIIGDPYYMVMGGIGNQAPVIEEPGLTTDATADHQSGQVLVRINFANPDDIDPATGFVRFNKSLIPYAGIYQVTEVKSNFKDGQFKQNLKLIRIPGQIVDDTVKPTDPIELNDKPKVGAQLKPDTAPAGVDKAGVRPSGFDLTKLLSRGLPSIGLPGNLSDFTGAGALGAVGGAFKLGQSVLGSASQIVGAVAQGAGIASQIGIPVGGNLNGLNALTNGLRTTAITAAGVGNIALGAGSLISQASATAGVKTDALSTNIVGQATSEAQKLSNATLSADNAVSAAGGIDKLKTLATDAGASAMSAVSNLGSGAAALVSGVGDKVKSLTAGLPSDPLASASKFGINPSQLAGLDPKLQSKVTEQLASIGKEIPADVDMTALTKSGVSLGNLTTDALKNIPATAKSLVAEAPELPDVKKLVAGATDRINAAKLAGGSLPDATALAGKFSSAESMLKSAGVGNLPTSVEGAMGKLTDLTGGSALGGFSASSIADLGKSATAKFGSISAKASSPLDKLISNNNGSEA